MSKRQIKQRIKPDLPLRGAIVAMTHQGDLIPDSRIIGVNGGLPWRHNRDLKRFKRITMGYAIIMGRITWQSIGCKPLPGRRNIVISRSAVSGVEYYHNIETAFTACGEQDLWVIGGAQIYEVAMPYLHLLDVTYVPDMPNVPDVTERDDVVKFPIIDPACWRVAKKRKLPKSDLRNVVYRRVDSG